MGGSHISCRRDASRHAAGRLVDRLAQTFPREHPFIDIDAIEPDLDFLDVINTRLDDCDVLLAVIGPDWADCRNADGVRRLDDPDDFVRPELEAALARVIPALVDGAPLPKADSLPEGLKPLVRRNAVAGSRALDAEADSLARSLAGVVKQPAPRGAAMQSRCRPTRLARSDGGEEPSEDRRRVLPGRHPIHCAVEDGGAFSDGARCDGRGLVLPVLPSWPRWSR